MLLLQTEHKLDLLLNLLYGTLFMAVKTVREQLDLCKQQARLYTFPKQCDRTTGNH